MNTTLTIQSLIGKYLLDRDIASTSRVTYGYILSYFFRYLIKQNKDPRLPSRADIISYKEHLVFDCKSEYTIDLYINALKGFFYWLAEQGYYSNISTGIKNIKRTRGFKKMPLTVANMNTLLSSIDRDTVCGKRDYAMIMLSLTAGLRVIELSRLRISDLAPDEVTIQRKGSITPNQTISICSKMHHAIEDYITARLENDEPIENSSPLFATHSLRSKVRKPIHAREVSRIIKDRLHTAGIRNKKISAHSLRHTAAVQLLESGEALTTIQRFLGHNSVNTTQLYTAYGEIKKLELSRPQKFLSDLIKD